MTLRMNKLIFMSSYSHILTPVHYHCIWLMSPVQLVYWILTQFVWLHALHLLFHFLPLWCRPLCRSFLEERSLLAWTFLQTHSGTSSWDFFSAQSEQTAHLCKKNIIMFPKPLTLRTIYSYVSIWWCNLLMKINKYEDVLLCCSLSAISLCFIFLRKCSAIFRAASLTSLSSSSLLSKFSW